jgi:methylglutaconyl-CoA hydratase
MFYHTTSNAKNTSLNFIKHENTAGLLKLTLNRPELHNAFNEVLINEITKSFNNLPADVRVVVLTGEGRSFSAGADLNWMRKMVNYTKEQNLADSKTIYDMMSSIKNCSVPVIARVNGASLGGGAGLVAAADMAFGLDSAIFGFTEVKLGLIPAVISPFVMDKIGRGSSSRYFLTGERFSAEEAVRIGLLNGLFTTVDELDTAVQNVVNEILSSGPDAVKRAKSLIANVARMDSREPTTREFTSNEIATARVQPEAQQRLKAFLDRSRK